MKEIFCNFIVPFQNLFYVKCILLYIDHIVLSMGEHTQPLSLQIDREAMEAIDDISMMTSIVY